MRPQRGRRGTWCGEADGRALAQVQEDGRRGGMGRVEYIRLPSMQFGCRPERERESRQNEQREREGEDRPARNHTGSHSTAQRRRGAGLRSLSPSFLTVCNLADSLLSSSPPANMIRAAIAILLLGACVSGEWDGCLLVAGQTQALARSHVLARACESRGGCRSVPALSPEGGKGARGCLRSGGERRRAAARAFPEPIFLEPCLSLPACSVCTVEGPDLHPPRRRHAEHVRPGAGERAAHGRPGRGQPPPSPCEPLRCGAARCMLTAGLSRHCSFCRIISTRPGL